MPTQIPSAGYVLDTCILVHLLRGGPIGEAINTEFEIRENFNRCVISVVTIGEILSFASSNAWGAKKKTLINTVRQNVTNADIANDHTYEAYCEIDCCSRKVGRKMGKNDIWIAALAKVSSATLLTSDRDFDHLHPHAIKRVLIDATNGSVLDS